MEIKRTFKELQEVDAMVGGLYQAKPTLKDSKFGYAYKRFTEKNYAPLVRDFNEELMGVRVQYALEDDKTKEVLIDRMNPRGFKYSKEGLKNVMMEERKLSEKWDVKEVVITPFLSPTIPEGLTEDQEKMLSGLVL